jgi:acetyl-CoA C-acetyltransferase
MGVHILGGSQTDFARKWSKDSDSPITDMMRDVAHQALDDAGVPASDVGTAHIGNFIGERSAGQAQLGGVFSMLDSAWEELPSSRHEAACASGSVAALAAAAEIEAGRYDVALVVGVELMRNRPGTEAALDLGSAAWVPSELNPDVLPWPYLFDKIAQETESRYGLNGEHLSRITEINRANARTNPNAQSRNWPDAVGQFDRDDTTNPLITGITRRSDCGLVTDGAAAVVLVSDEYLDRWERSRSGKARSSTIAGWGHRTGPISIDRKFELSAGEQYLFPHVRRAITEAQGRAKIGGIEDIDVIETHDCFSITEYAAIDHFGITAPGESWKAVEDGSIEKSGRIPINPSGGLLGTGHPVGATGVRMLVDAHRQVSGTADGYQIDDVNRVATLNVGGSFTTAVSFVVERTGLK